MATATKQLKFWNGRPHGQFLRNKQYPQAHFYIAAYSRAEAQRILKQIDRDVVNDEVKDYYNEGGWDSNMDQSIAKEPGIWVGYKAEGRQLYIQLSEEEVFLDTPALSGTAGTGKSYTENMTTSVEDILEARAQEWWSKKSTEGKQVASSLYNFSGKLTVKEMYIEHQVRQYDKLARVSAIALQIAQSSKELGLTPAELMSPNGLLLMEAEKQYSKL